jgi:hypothetical protein
MPRFNPVNDPFTREQKRPAFEELRRSSAQRAAWETDNKKRKEEGQPTRTLVRGALGFTIPPPSVNHHNRLDIEQTQLPHLHQILPRKAS